MLEIQAAVVALAAVEVRIRRGPAAGDRSTDAAHKLVFADQLATVSVRSRHRAIHGFVHDLRVARGVLVIHEILRRRAAHGFRDAVTVAIVDKREQT